MSASQSHVSFSKPNVEQPLFPLGRLVATPGALALLMRSEQTPLEFVSRHARGDWGACDDHDACTINYLDDSGVCQQDALPCDDNDACTTDINNAAAIPFPEISAIAIPIRPSGRTRKS